jgi:hypothetical protein
VAPATALPALVETEGEIMAENTDSGLVLDGAALEDARQVIGWGIRYSAFCAADEGSAAGVCDAVALPFYGGSQSGPTFRNGAPRFLGLRSDLSRGELRGTSGAHVGE